MECQKHPASPVSKSYTALLLGALPLHPATSSRPRLHPPSEHSGQAAFLEPLTATWGSLLRPAAGEGHAVLKGPAAA